MQPERMTLSAPDSTLTFMGKPIPASVTEAQKQLSAKIVLVQKGVSSKNKKKRKSK